MMNNKAISASGLLQTGQRSCHDPDGRVIPCQDTGQDAEFRAGQAWPETRFDVQGNTVLDKLTDLVWSRNANIAEFPHNWHEALEFVTRMNTTSLYEPDWAWALYMDKGAVGVGQKRFARFYMWAVTDAV